MKNLITEAKELINDNVEQILLLLKNLTDSNGNGSLVLKSSILDCLNSWIKEFPIDQLLQIDSLVNLIFGSFSNDENFEKQLIV